MNEELKIIFSAEFEQVKQATKQIQGELDKVSEETNKSSGKFKTALGKMGSAAETVGKTIKKSMVAVGAAVGAAVAAVSASMVKGIKDTAEYGDNIDKLSQKMGFSAEAYQEWDFILQHSGSSMETLKASMKTLTTAADSGSEAFKRLGISQQELSTLSPEALFERTLTALQGVESETERVALAGKVLGRGATELGPLLNTSAEDIEAMKQQVHDLGGVMSDSAVKDAAAFQDALQNLQTATSGLTHNLTAQLLPGISDIMTGLSQVVSGDDNGFALIEQGITNLTTTIQENLPQIVEFVINTGLMIIENIIPLIPSIVQAVCAVIPQLITKLVELLPSIIEVLISSISTIITCITECLPDVIDAVIQAIPQIIDCLITAIPQLLDAGVQLFMAIVDAIPVFLPDLIAKLPEIIDSLLDMLLNNLSTILDAGVQLFLALVDAIPVIIPVLVEALPDIIDSLVDALIDSIPILLEAGVELFMGLVESIPVIIPELINGLADIVSTITTNLINKLLDLMGFDWELPKLKLPHITIDGEFSLSPPSIPKFGISWYAKGGVFDSTHLFGFGGGSIGGLGEDGAEAIVPLEKNTQWLDRIAERLGGNAPIYLMVDGRVLGEVAVDNINAITRQRGSIPLNIV